jgi:predicted nuclease of predicted toxin-antitoxin system
VAEDVRFYLDEHIANLVTIGLRQRGVDVLTTDEAGRSGMPDPAQLQFAAAEERLMVTFDADYLQLAAAGARHYGIAYCHPTKYAPSQLLQILLVLHGVMSRDEVQDHVEFL